MLLKLLTALSNLNQKLFKIVIKKEITLAAKHL